MTSNIDPIPSRASRRTSAEESEREGRRLATEQARSELPDDEEEELVDDASRLTAPLIYEVIRRDGEAELARPVQSLLWSGIAAGILISFSLVGEAVLRHSLPDTPQRFLIENLGYSLGFILVILGRMQLFTENTITTVLPLTIRFCQDTVYRTSRLWAVVLSANVIGAFIAAVFIAYTGAFTAEMQFVIAELSRHATGMGAAETFARGVPAGVLIAAIVWMLPSSHNNAFMIILAFTWLIAAGDFTHVVAGSVEMAYLMVTGEMGLLQGVFRFFIPVLLGNVVGGTAVFGMLVWGQVQKEVEERGKVPV